MNRFQFHKSEKGQGNEDWYYLEVDSSTRHLSVVHTWSHSVGTASFRDGEHAYSLQEFSVERPNQYRKLLEWLNERLKLE